MRLLGLDVGDRRIGLAISDPNGKIAVPLRVLRRVALEQDIAAIAALVKAEEVERVVAGLPLRLDGSVGSQAESVQEFVRRLLPAVGVPVTLWDERFSSVQADELLRHDDRRASRRGKAEQDALAAAIILQAYLDSGQE